MKATQCNTIDTTAVFSHKSYEIKKKRKEKKRNTTAIINGGEGEQKKKKFIFREKGRCIVV
ncbi:Uncharacterized protein APZ42_028473 [Daphnia magna]|uniref:Uncharacterized protein n=1 Tax=Daphnia magna TaxID=35525 RepID=A0A164QGZ9_9CRUS|nr:Uncharacterized protein APZ42_028473 [Daphnia magna]